jgi:type IV fimbrial biogenesis protein FimT
MQRSGSCRGYSLFELIMTMTLAALVLTLGIPSFSSIVANHRLKVETDALFHAIHLARKSSIVRRRVVTICPSPDGERCEQEFDWSRGWMMFVNTDRDRPASRDDGEAMLRFHRVGPETRIMSNRESFSLRSTDLRATNGTIIICDAGGRGTARALVISYTGRPRVAREDSRGRPYACPD